MTDYPYVLILETSAIVQTDINTWQAIAKLGECLLPQIVATEIKNIANGNTEGNEILAKQFQNLLPQLNWKITNLTAKHPEILLSTSQNLSRKAKLILTVAQSAIGVANNNPKRFVVLISDEISLRDRIAKLGHASLCTIPSAIARQWARTNQAPPLVQQLINQLKEEETQTICQSSPQPNTISLSPLNHQSDRPSSHKVRPNSRHIAISLMKFGITTTFLVTILLFSWRFFQPQQFQKFWEKAGLPPLPKASLYPIQPK